MTSVTTTRNNGDDERIKKHYKIMNRELILRKRYDSVTRAQIHCQARSKQCLIGPAISKLSAGDLGAG